MLIPGAIVLAGVIIAGTIFFKDRPVTSPSPAKGQAAAAGSGPSNGPEPETGSVDQVRPVSQTDHLIGNAAAPVKIIEFSDLECPFCKQFHFTMKQVMNDYGKVGRVAWVYRHFPLDSLHPKASGEAEAAECAGELGGNIAFWNYIDKIFAITPSNNGLDPVELPKTAESLGLDRQKFEDCLAEGKYAAVVKADYNDAVKSGGHGTPYSIVIAQNGTKYTIPGALQYDQVKPIIESALNAN